MILNAKSRYHLNDTVPDSSSSSPIAWSISNSEVELDSIPSGNRVNVNSLQRKHGSVKPNE